MSSIANSTWVLDDERKKILQEGIKNFNLNSLPAGRPDSSSLANPSVMPNIEYKQAVMPTKSEEKSTSKLFGAYNKNLILVVLAVAGYFAYKKFKK